GGLLARGAGGGKQKANGRLSYREILFNNDGKLRPQYSAGPCASASAGYLFPKAEDQAEERREEEANPGQGPAPPRTGFHYSEKYCPATGPQRPPRRQVLLSASLKLTEKLSPSPARPCSRGGAGSMGPPWAPPPAGGQRSEPAGAGGVGVEPTGGGRGEAGRDGGAVGSGRAGAAAGAERWRDSNGTSGVKAGRSLTHSAAAGAGAGAGAGAAGIDGRLPAMPRRYGTYEREHQERGSVLHYLTVATLLRTRPANPTAAASADAGANHGGGSSGGGSGGGSSGGGVNMATAAAAPVPPHPDGATAPELLAAMRESPWEGRPRATGTRREWTEWLMRLEPTLERHLRW
ncbi:unnamed protein product, partial [Laminaria digitata]